MAIEGQQRAQPQRPPEAFRSSRLLLESPCAADRPRHLAARVQLCVQRARCEEDLPAAAEGWSPRRQNQLH